MVVTVYLGPVRSGLFVWRTPWSPLNGPVARTMVGQAALATNGRSATEAGTHSLVRPHQLVTGVLGTQLGELGGTGLLIGTESVGELTRTDVVKDRLHGGSDVSVDHSRAGQQTAVLGRR